MSYDKTNKGAFFKNDDKESDTHPDYKGSLNVGGVEYWIDGWINTADSGRKYMSLKVKPTEKKASNQKSNEQKPASRSRRDDYDEPPF